MEDWEDILATRKWPDGSDVTVTVIQATKSKNPESSAAVSHTNRVILDKKLGKIDKSSVEKLPDFGKISRNRSRRKGRDESKSARTPRSMKVEMAVASKSARSRRSRRNDCDRSKAIANVTSRRKYRVIAGNI